MPSHNEMVVLFGEQAVQASRITPFSTALNQVAITPLYGLGWYVGSWFAGASTVSAAEAGLSVLLDDDVCVVFSAWFTTQLSTVKGFESIVRPVVGEAVKVLDTVALPVIVVMVFEGLRWPSLLIILILTPKMCRVGLALRQYVESTPAHHDTAGIPVRWHTVGA